MKYLKPIVALVLFFCFNNSNAQSTTLEEDANFEQLLIEKRKINSSLSNPNSYKIQIFNGTSEESKNNLIAFKKENRNFDATIIFSTPKYKVLVGNFSSRIEAERNLNFLKKKYPTAIIVKPGR